MKTYKNKILIDLDGVLNQYKGNYDENYIPKIKEGAEEFKKKLVNLLNYIYLQQEIFYYLQNG